MPKEQVLILPKKLVGPMIRGLDSHVDSTRSGPDGQRIHTVERNERHPDITESFTLNRDFDDPNAPLTLTYQTGGIVERQVAQVLHIYGNKKK